eukprot:1301562-Rhodomonas_salina.1
MQERSAPGEQVHTWTVMHKASSEVDLLSNEGRVRVPLSVPLQEALTCSMTLQSEHVHTTCRSPEEHGQQW